LSNRTPSVELAGYLSAAVGVGEAARRYLLALRRAGVPTIARDVPLPGRDAAGVPFAPAREPAASEVGCNLLCLNPEQLLPYLDDPQAPTLAGRRSVGVWSWEVDLLPGGWREAARGLAEVWTYSRFAAEQIGAGVGVPVFAVPPPIRPPAGRAAPRVELPGGFRVLVMFDYLSTLERKNPLGAIEAFRKAFAPGDGAVLILKSVNGRHRAERSAELAAAAGGREDIVRIDRTMTGSERDALVAGCDCFVSLHRSEGHGLPLAEAMSLGKPVLATGYGGNTEFMSEENSYLVGWQATRVGEGVEHYPAEATWAEPDVEQAARLLRAVHDRPETARARAQRAQADVRRLLSAEAVGQRMRARLEAIERDRRAGRLRRAGRGLRRALSGAGPRGRWEDPAA
jgi:glycosyltransferase involved in cell wall biosynthesis